MEPFLKTFPRFYAIWQTKEMKPLFTFHSAKVGFEQALSNQCMVSLSSNAQPFDPYEVGFETV